MKKKDIQRWINEYLGFLAVLMIVIGVGGATYVAGFYNGAQRATQFYNDTISELQSRCIMISPAANSSIKTTFTFKHGDEGTYRPQDWAPTK